MTTEISYSLLAPAAALIVWTLLVLLWMAVIRGGAFRKAAIDLSKAQPGGRGQDLDKLLPPPANWPAHNYSHLVEQPTIFYPTLVVLALLGQGNSLNMALAWIYVGLRIVHSIWQIRVNTIPVRAALFLLSTLALLVLAVNALVAALGRA